MNNNNLFPRKTAFICLVSALSACSDPFDPATAPELAARWTADSLALRDGDVVSMWPDSSLQGHDAMATASSRPIYKVVDGVPVVRFDGIDDHLTTSSPTDWTFLKNGSDWTVFIVFRSATGNEGGQHVLLNTDGQDSGFTVSYTDRLATNVPNAVRLAISAETAAFDVDLSASNRSFPPGRWGIVSAYFKGSADGHWGEAGLFVNGYRKAATETWVRPDRSRGRRTLNIGRNGEGDALYTKGDIREIVIYRRTLSEEEHYAVLQHLSAKVSPAIRLRTPFSQKWLSYNPERYQGFGIAFRIPTTGKLVAIQRQGMGHVGGPIGEIRQWESTDRGVTWTNSLTYDSPLDDRNVGGGLAPKTGTILVFLVRYDGTYFRDMRALRSVDDAQSFTDIGAPLPTNGCWGFSPYGPLVEMPSGRLLQTFYGCDDIYKVWVSESVDDGLTWTHKADIYRGPLRVNETSLVWISGADDATSTLMAVARNESGGGLLQFVSRDGGDTWTNQGLIPGGHLTDVSPWLHRLSDGTIVNAWHERSWFGFNIRIGRAEDVAASPANWGPALSTYRATTQIVGDSGYPALLSATGSDDDLIQVIYDRAPGGNANLLIVPISLP